MGIETEIKIQIESTGEFIRRVLSYGASCISRRSFEDNILFDFPDDRLKLTHCMLRVRSIDGRGILTYKGAPKPEGIFKSREELEISVESLETAVEILGRIGMRQGFRYQKYRQEFALDGVCVAVDETPIGKYAELEGTEDEIINLAGKLCVAESCFIRKSYHALYLDFCSEREITPQSMIF